MRKWHFIKSLTDSDHKSKKGLVAEKSGFSLHAGVACEANERDKLERVASYIARPAVAEERLSTNPAGEVVYKFKKPWDDGTTALRLTPLEFIERLVGLVPRPRVHLTRFHGVLAPHYWHRQEVVPRPKPQLTAVDDEGKSENPRAMNWAKLLARVFGIDVETCPLCQGKACIIAAIKNPAVIKKILEHLGLPTSPPRFHPARGPPATQLDENAQGSSHEFDHAQAFPG